MRLTSLVVTALGLLGGIAVAQPTEPGPGTTDVSPIPPPEPPPPPQPPQPAQPAQPAQPQPHTMMMTEHPEGHGDGVRPTELAFAIGLGYVRPPGGSLDLQTPNIASARLRLISGLTFEPSVTIANTSQDTNNGTTDTSDTTTELSLGTLVRLPVIRHGRVDFEVLGSLAFDVIKNNPDGDYNTQTTTGLGLGWGIAIGYWFGPHWQLSASATNPLLTYSSVKQETGPTTETKTGTTTFSVQFDPAVIVMLHLYN